LLTDIKTSTNFFTVQPWEGTMIQTAALPGTVAQPDSRSALDAIFEAYAAGDNLIAEMLFTQALDDGLPWDDVCAAAARGIARRYGEQPRG
jgi:hypothetical protein